MTAAATMQAATNKIDDPKYSKEEAAKLLGISAITVWREVERGRLGCYRICGGRVLRIGRSHIEKYLSEYEQES